MGDGITRDIAIIVQGGTSNFDPYVEEARESLSHQGYEVNHFATSCYYNGFDSFLNRIGADDDDNLVLIFYGHGIEDEYNNALLCSSAMEGGRGTYCGDLASDIASIPYGNRTVIMFQCYGGNENLVNMFARPNTTFISAGSDGEVIYAHSRFGHSLFRRFERTGNWTRSFDYAARQTLGSTPQIFRFENCGENDFIQCEYQEPEVEERLERILSGLHSRDRDLRIVVLDNLQSIIPELNPNQTTRALEAISRRVQRCRADNELDDEFLHSSLILSSYFVDNNTVYEPNTLLTDLINEIMHSIFMNRSNIEFNTDTSYYNREITRVYFNVSTFFNSLRVFSLIAGRLTPSPSERTLNEAWSLLDMFLPSGEYSNHFPNEAQSIELRLFEFERNLPINDRFEHALNRIQNNTPRSFRNIWGLLQLGNLLPQLSEEQLSRLTIEFQISTQNTANIDSLRQIIAQRSIAGIDLSSRGLDDESRYWVLTEICTFRNSINESERELIDSIDEIISSLSISLALNVAGQFIYGEPTMLP